ncbi:hypothetical protein [Methanolacinia paynteri]|uniref:hypothetical protein n=1 Tax=Methanolacinia paynteri TaxID=230356 RepID=UPI0012F63B60|nr:hypothetical protein [Methanolacinia paynteri]
MKKFILKIPSLLLVMMLLLVVGITPAMACEPGTACYSASNNAIDTKPVVTELAIQDQISYIDEANLNEKFKTLEFELLKKGYTAQHIEAFKAQVPNQDGNIDDFAVVAAVYGIKDEDQKSILFIKNEKTGVTTTILIKGDALADSKGISMCVISAAACIVGCATCAGLCAAEAVASDDGYACTLCMVGACSLTCFAAICTCADACCEAGNQWCCDHKCP